MTKQNPTPPPVAGNRRDSLRQQRLAEQQAARRRTVAVRVGIAVVAAAAIVGVVAAIGLAMGSSRATTAANAPVAQTTASAPSAVDASGAIVLGNASAPTTVTIYTDFICPYCGEFDRANGSVLSQAVASGGVKLEIFPLNFLDDASKGTKYSTRAANAFATVANADPSAALAFYQALYQNQPAENSTGLSDQQIADLAAGVGVPADVVSSFADQKYVAWLDELTANRLPTIQGTPTIKINGTLFDGDPYHAGPFEAALAKARQG